MPAAKPALQKEPSTVTLLDQTNNRAAANIAVPGPRRITDHNTAVPPFPAQPRTDTSFQPRLPAIIGEATYRGLIPVDGIITAQLGATGGVMTIKQRPKNAAASDIPELNGELTFKDMLRVNGHIAGKVFSNKGTLIVDASAKVEAHIDVAVCVISGMVVGDVVGHQRVEMGSGAVVEGNISTRALSIKPGAVFHGECRMLKEENSDK